jgi:hypothetical protein
MKNTKAARRERRVYIYRPTKGQWAAIRKGEAALARGDYVTLEEMLAALKRSESQITLAISESTGRFKSGRYEA